MDRQVPDRDEPGETASGRVSTVIGDIDRKTTGGRSRGTASVPGARRKEGSGDAPLEALRVMRYPEARDNLIRDATDRGVPRELLDRLAHLPNRMYGSAEDLIRELRRAE